MEINATLGSRMAVRIGSAISVRQPGSPTSAGPLSPCGQSPPPSIFCMSPTSESYLANDVSLGGSFSGCQLPSHTMSPNPSPRHKMNSPLQVGAFYSEYAGGSASASSEEDEKRDERPRSPIATVRGTKRNFYEVLGVGQDANLKDIRAAYRSKALECHPDLAPPQEKAHLTELFAQINEAYSTLSDPHSRSLYDAKLSLFRPESVPHVPGFNSYSYNFTGFKTDIWARNAGVKTDGMSSHESSPRASHPSAASAVSTTSSISSGWRGRNWETDQCWC